jgi:hypothetical protein
LSQTVVINGVSYSQPTQGTAQPWGDVQAEIIVALVNSCLQKTGGSFTLSADADFGASFGLKSAYYSSRTTNPASAGSVRLAKTDVISFRNNANGANLDLGINGSDRLTFNGATFDGNIVGPGSSTDNAIARFDLTTGKLLQNSSVLIDDSNNITGAVDASLSGTVSLTGSNLAVGSAPTANKMYPNSMIKAWAYLDVGTAGAVTVSSGFNIASASYSANVLTVLFHTAMTSSKYACSFVYKYIGGATTSVPQLESGTTSTTQFLVKKFDLAGAASNFSNADAIMVIVCGLQ